MVWCSRGCAWQRALYDEFRIHLNDRSEEIKLICICMFCIPDIAPEKGTPGLANPLFAVMRDVFRHCAHELGFWSMLPGVLQMGTAVNQNRIFHLGT
jgi:hypothetical protein